MSTGETTKKGPFPNVVIGGPDHFDGQTATYDVFIYKTPDGHHGVPTMEWYVYGPTPDRGSPEYFRTDQEQFTIDFTKDGEWLLVVDASYRGVDASTTASRRIMVGTAPDTRDPKYGMEIQITQSSQHGGKTTYAVSTVDNPFIAAEIETANWTIFSQDHYQRSRIALDQQQVSAASPMLMTCNAQLNCTYKGKNQSWQTWAHTFKTELKL